MGLAPPVDVTRAGDGAAVVAQQLAALARDLQQQQDTSSVVQVVARWAVRVVPGAQQASVSLVSRRRTTTLAATTGGSVASFHELQQRVGQGPAADSVREHQSVRTLDLSQEDRWPGLAARWGEVGVRSVLCLPLFVRGQDLGVVSLVSDEVGAFADAAEQVGLLVAAHAAVAVAGVVEREGLATANANRTVIGQAEGILMERLKVSAEVAFAMLAKISQDTNRKLHRVAEDLVVTGEVPTRSEGG